jgi:hypothetical protein
MSGIAIRGFEELRLNTDQICKDVLDRAIQAAEDAAAQVIRQAGNLQTVITAICF